MLQRNLDKNFGNKQMYLLHKDAWTFINLNGKWFYTRKIKNALHQIQEFGKQHILLQFKVFIIFCKQSYGKYAWNLHYS